MTLSKQLYFIISIIFFMIFTGNFVLSVKNTKEYLQIESISKAQDTATTLGFVLKNLIHDKENPEIEATINAVSNSGFYKEIRLEDALFTIKESDLIKASKDLNNSQIWEVSNILIDEKLGKIETSTISDDFEKELLTLNGSIPNEKNAAMIPSEDVYTFIPTHTNNGKIELSIKFTAKNQFGKSIETKAVVNLNKILVQVDREIKFDSVPEIFIKLLPINLEEQYTEISDGWKTSAVLYVSANPGEAYSKLYEQVKEAIIYATFMFIISIIIAFIFIQYILKPLKTLENLANGISEGRFNKIIKMPRTKELNGLSIAFNDMSNKIEATISRLNLNIENMSKKLTLDEVTSLPLKQTFETDMKQMFIYKTSGYVFSIKLFDLATFAKSHTSSEINDFIKQFANIISTSKIDENSNITAYRFFGSEFAIIAKDFTYENAILFSKILQSKFGILAEKFAKKDIAHIGGTPFNHLGSSLEMLQSANQAYEKATLIGQNEFFITNENEIVKDMEDWRSLVYEIIDNSNFEVKYIGNFTRCSKNTNDIIMQEAFTSVKDRDNKDIPIGTFVSIAEKYERIVDFDKKVITKVINHILVNNVNHDIAINLSLESINNTAFIAWLEKTLNNSKEAVSKLVFSVTAYAVAKDIDKFKFFVDEVHRFGAKIIIKRYETRFISLSDIKDLNLDYLRLAREYTNDVCIDFSKQSFIESIAELSNLLNIKVLAESVQKEEDYNYIKELKLFAASR